MTYGLNKVRSGDSLQIPAKAYNAFVDAALDQRQRSLSTTGDALRDQKQSNFVLVKNESGAARAQFDVLAIHSPIIARADNGEAFRSRIALRGVTPTAEHVGRFVILHDALPNGTVGRAYVTGACLARVRMLDDPGAGVAAGMWFLPGGLGCDYLLRSDRKRMVAACADVLSVCGSRRFAQRAPTGAKPDTQQSCSPSYLRWVATHAVPS